MSLSPEALSRLADVVELQPTKNAELAERWGLESGKEVHQYLESELSDYYYRDDNSLIRATPEAASLVDVEPGIESDSTTGNTVVRINDIQSAVYSVLSDEPGESKSVVAVLQAVRSSSDLDPTVAEVRSTLSSLRRMGLVAVEYRSVPTYYRADDTSIEILVQD